MTAREEILSRDYTEVTEDKERIVEFLEGALKIVKGES